MCYGCLNENIKTASHDLDDKPFGTIADSAMGHGGIAIRSNTKFDGLGATSMKFEGLPAQSVSDAKQVENSGRGN
jgi:hypothetical protein